MNRPGLRRTWAAVAVWLALVIAMPLHAAVEGQGLAATRALAAKLVANGRGEADVTLTRSDPLGGPALIQRGRLVLEPPTRMRLDFPQSGERLAVRAGGGEWVQPGPRQMIRLSRDQTATVAGLWSVFLYGGGERFVERRAGERRWEVEPRNRDEGLPDLIRIRLDARGLPVSLETDDPIEGTTRYDFRAWRFARAAGDRGFTLLAPKGFAIVDLP